MTTDRDVLFHGAAKIDAAGRVDGFWMRIADGRIVETGTGRPPGDEDRVDLGGGVLVPGFVDLHAHGAGGHAYDDGENAIRAALATHRAHGTTRSVVSLVANPLPMLAASLETIARIAGTDPLVLGAHLEAPFLAPARRGAHHPDFLRPPEPEAAERLLAAAAGTLAQVTLAPELPGALEVIDGFVAAGVRVAIGHTDADADTARRAFDRGASILTHAYNAMPGIHHRDPGPIVAAFGDDRVTLELILDGHHVHPAVAALTMQAAPGRVALVTDAMAAAGNADGDYLLGSLNVAVRDGVAMLRGTPTIAGSTLTQDAELRVALGPAGIDPVAAVAALTVVPARALGLGDRLGMLAPGYAADAVLLDADWRVRRVWADGRELTALD